MLINDSEKKMDSIVSDELSPSASDKYNIYCYRYLWIYSSSDELSEKKVCVKMVCDTFEGISKFEEQLRSQAFSLHIDKVIREYVCQYDCLKLNSQENIYNLENDPLYNKEIKK